MSLFPSLSLFPSSQKTWTSWPSMTTLVYPKRPRKRRGCYPSPRMERKAWAGSAKHYHQRYLSSLWVQVYFEWPEDRSGVSRGPNSTPSAARESVRLRHHCPTAARSMREENHQKVARVTIFNGSRTSGTTASLGPPDLRDFDVGPSSAFRPHRRSSRRVADWCPDR